MAKLYRPTGEIEEVKPAAKNKWTLKELQELVGGDIELMPSVAPLRMLFHELGKILDLPTNDNATKVLHTRMAQRLGVSIEQLPAEIGKRLRYLPTVRGNALVLDVGERM